MMTTTLTTTLTATDLEKSLKVLDCAGVMHPDRHIQLVHNMVDAEDAHEPQGFHEKFREFGEHSNVLGLFIESGLGFAVLLEYLEGLRPFAFAEFFNLLDEGLGISHIAVITVVMLLQGDDEDLNHGLKVRAKVLHGGEVLFQKFALFLVEDTLGDIGADNVKHEVELGAHPIQTGEVWRTFQELPIQSLIKKFVVEYRAFILLNVLGRVRFVIGLLIIELDAGSDEDEVHQTRLGQAA